MDTVRDRFVHAVVPPAAEIANLDREAKRIAAAEQSDGSWSDIDYKNQARSNWLTVKHLNNLLAMAKAYRAAPGDAMKEKLITGLAWWLKNDPHNPNWWHNEIGVPQLLGETALLLGDDLPEDQRARIIEIMKRSKWDKWTGQNLVWGCGNQVVRGILSRDEKTVADAYARMYEEIVVEKPQGEGILPDASFHQHGSQFYSGGYGLDFANDVGRFVAYAWDTKFAPPKEKMDIYARFMLDGEQWMVRGATFDYSACGREITRRGKTALPRDWALGPVTPSGAAYGLGSVVETLANLDVPRRTEFQEFAARLHEDPSAKPLSGNHYYWCSDYMAHQRSDFFASVRMFSSRTLNTEIVNDEGKKSHHLADGCTFIYRSGDEYRDIFPYWDWNKVPGTTAEQMDLALDKGGNHMKGQSDFVGGVSDGTYGLCVQDLVHGKLKAHKFWMMFDNGFAALGAGINCDSEHPVITSINQCLLDGDASKSDQSVSHDHFTYIIPGQQKFELTTAAQTGRWSDIGTGPSEPVTQKVFNLWIDHGDHPKDASYVYFVLAGEQKDSGIDVLSNTPELQSVIDRKLNLLGIAFWKAGTLQSTGVKTIEVDQPCLVMLQKLGDTTRLSISDPQNEAMHVNVTIEGKQIPIDLPSGSMAGSTIVKEIKSSE